MVGIYAAAAFVAARIQGILTNTQLDYQILENRQRNIFEEFRRHENSQDAREEGHRER